MVLSVSRISAVIAAIVLFGCTAQISTAQGTNPPIIPVSQISGVPLIVKRNLPPGVYIRRQDKEIMLVTHGAVPGITFTGRIITENGPIVNPRPQELEKAHKEGFVAQSPNVLNFRFFTLGDIDMLAFRAPRGQRVSIEVLANGQPVPQMAFGGDPKWVKGNKVIIDLTQ